jgi:hypothetical protein
MHKQARENDTKWLIIVDRNLNFKFILNVGGAVGFATYFDTWGYMYGRYRLSILLFAGKIKRRSTRRAVKTERRGMQSRQQRSSLISEVCHCLDIIQCCRSGPGFQHYRPTEAISEIFRHSRSVADPNPKESETFCRIRIQKKNSDSDLDTDSDPDTII